MDMRQLPVVVRRQVPAAFLPNNYIVACQAIKECARVDEAAEMANKAAAIATYARESADTTLKVNAEKIKVRAERRIGELIEELYGNKQNEYGGKIGSYEMAGKTALSHVRVAAARSLKDIPEKTFENVMNVVSEKGQVPITARRVIEQHKYGNAQRRRTRQAKKETYEDACIEMYEHLNHRLHEGTLAVGIMKETGENIKWRKPVYQMFIHGMVNENDFMQTLKYLDVLIECAPALKTLVLDRQKALRSLKSDKVVNSC